MMQFEKVSCPLDALEVFATADGFYRIYHKRNGPYVLKAVSLFNIMGDTIGEYDTLQKAIDAAQ